MRFVETPLAGCFIVESEPVRDERGFFARISDVDELADHGLHGEFVQVNLTWNERPLTLRGIHFQREPHLEAKFVRCTRGRLFDVAVDLRLGSPTRFAWFGIEMDAGSRQALYIPAGFGHGYLTLEPDTELTYGSTARYRPEFASGVPWNDPVLGIEWPATPEVMSATDRSWGPISPDEFSLKVRQ